MYLWCRFRGGPLRGLVVLISKVDFNCSSYHSRSRTQNSRKTLDFTQSISDPSLSFLSSGFIRSGDNELSVLGRQKCRALRLNRKLQCLYTRLVRIHNVLIHRSQFLQYWYAFDFSVDICAACHVFAYCPHGRCKCRHGYVGDGMDCYPEGKFSLGHR